ncbi:MAG: DNA polymerase IV [Gemmatimonadaceae bacterium]|nr:DNA polymerase IV [Gemmatimonadaceae bacterium]
MAAGDPPPAGDPPARRIILVDADAFFVAVARLVDPAGAGRARLLIVGGGGTRGVVCSASYETREFGVRSAMPTARALRLCPGAMVVPVPHSVCGQKSREIRAALERFSPVVQGASIDEWYVDLSGTEALYAHASLRDVAHRIRAAVQAETGLTVSIGGATNRLVAKIAVERAKPKPGTHADGVFVVAPGQESAFLETVALADIPLVGPRFRESLASRGLRTVSDVLAVDLASLTRMLGARAARWLHDRVRGIDDSAVRSRDMARSLSHEETFGHDLSSDEDLDRELVHLVTRVAHDLRHDGLMARTVTLKLRDGDFTTRSAGRTLPAAVLSDRVILTTARALLARLRRARRVPARLLGVALTGLEDADVDTQLSLFAGDVTSPVESQKDRALSQAIDAVRQRFGRDAVVPGRLADGKRRLRR